MTGRGKMSADRVVRVLLGVLLLAAASLKAHQLATEPVAGEGLLSSRWFQVVWVEVEIALGLWFVSGLARRVAWAAVLACFALFSIVTLAKALAGEVSCGCFGALEVNPWYTLLLDVGAVGALVLFRPALRTAQPAVRRRARLATAVLAGLAFGVPAALFALGYEPARLSTDGRIVGDQRIVLLEPETWVGKPWPLLTHIDIGTQLAKGQWTVVLYHHDCPHCQERVPELASEARERAERMNIARTAMVELAPYAPPGRSLLPPGTACVPGRVSDRHDWFVTTPTLLALIDGTVVEVSEGVDRAGAAETSLAAWRNSSGERPVPIEDDGHAFGFVEPGSVQRATLGVRNPSAQPLTVRRVQSECLCMAAETPRGAIQPGGTIPVRVVFVAPKKSLIYDKRLLLQTDDPKHPLIPVRIRAEVGLAMEVHPSPLDCGVLAVGEEREEPLTVRNRGTKPVRLTYSTSSTSGCFVRVPREAVPAGGERAVPVVVRAQGRGPQRVTISVHTDLESQPSFAIPIRFETADRTAAGAPPSAAVATESAKPKG